MTTLALADRRLRYLYEISTLLTRFGGIDETLPRVVDVAARALSIRTAALVVDTHEGLRAHVWKTDEVGAFAMDSAHANARASYSWFTTGSPHVVRASPPPSVRPLPASARASATTEDAAAPRRYVVLPLVVQRSHVFGVLQIESTSMLAEADVLFLDAVTNQVAVAIDRQMAIDAAEGRVRAQLDFTQALTESLGEGVLAIDLDGRISFMNPAAEEILGHRERAVAGKPIDEVLRVRSAEGADGDAVECPLREALATNRRVVSDDHVFSTSDGRAVPVSYIAAPIDSAHGPSGAVLAFRDVLGVKRSERTQRLLAECSAALSRSLDRGAMIDALVDCLVPSFADACFIDESDVQDVAAVLSRLTELTVPLFARGHSFGRLTFVMTHSGRTYAAADVAAGEEIGRRTAIAFENAGLYEQAEKAVRDRQEIIAVVSHDLRSPLSTMRMAVETLRERARPEEGGRNVLDIIARAVERMLRMTEDLLDVASIEANHLAVDPKPTSVSAIMRDLVEAMQARADARSVELSVAQPDPMIVAACDHDRILQVLTNLVGNAIKFTPPGGSVDIVAEADEHVVRFIVCDTGSGISADLLPHVFERNRQAAETASQGRGLGLFITRGIIEAHGAQIHVESEPGVGTAFEFFLPRIVGRPIVKTTSTEDAFHRSTGS